MTDKAYAVPLHEQLARVPRDARLVIDDHDGTGTQYIPVGAYCHEAAEVIRARLAQPEPWVKTYSGGKPNYTESCERCGEVNPAEIHTCTPKQPKPKPVAVWELQEGGWDTIADAEWMESLPIGTKLYTAPPQREWVGLTDDEIDDIWAEFNDGYGIIEETLWGYERAIEAKLKEKNG